MWLRAFVVGVCVSAASCASGGAATTSDDDSPHDAATQQHDAHVSTIDAAHHDAMVSTPDAPPDAFVRPDAPPGALICGSDGDCTASQCCFDFGTPPGFCVDGADFLGVCVPNGN
jgi:hypothetical protein